jgi:hypothetical protein
LFGLILLILFFLFFITAVAVATIAVIFLRIFGLLFLLLFFTELLSEKFCVFYDAFLVLTPFGMGGDAVDDGKKRKLIYAIMFCT